MGKPRILIVAGHFAEIAVRFGTALASHADVRLLVEAGNLAAELGDSPLPRGLRVATYKGKSIRRMMPALAWQVLTFRPQVVQFEETTSPWLATLVRLSRLSARTVLRVHDVQTHSGRDYGLSARTQRSREWVRRHVDLVLVHGRFCRDAFARSYPTPVYESMHGVLHVPTVEQVRAPDAGRLLMFGRFEVYRGLEVLVDAMHLVRAQGVAAPLTVVGRGPELTRLRSSLSAIENVEIVEGFMPAAEVPACFQCADLVLLPHVDATQSGVAAAAVGNHRPVIASRTGGLPDVIQDGLNGRLVPPGDAGALADAIVGLLSSPADLARMTQGAAVMASTLLSWDKIAADVAPRLKALAHAEG